MATKALITGVTGFVGSHLADYLLANTDWDVVGLCRWRSPLDNIRHLIPSINKGKRVRLAYADIRDYNAVENIITSEWPDYVFHLAAQSYPQVSFKSPNDTLETNIQGTTNVLEAMRKHRSDAIIHVCSSSEIFGRVPKELTPIKEDCPFHPASPYAISKVGTDLLGRHYAEAYKMNVQVTRMFTHTGPRRGDVFAESSFAKQIAMIEQELISPFISTGNLNSMRTWADVRDAVRAYHMAVTINPVPGATYNIGGENSGLVLGTLMHLIALSDLSLDIKLEEDPARLRPIDADLQIPDTSKFRAHTGWKPEISYEKTMSDLLEYWRSKVLREGAQLTR